MLHDIGKIGVPDAVLLKPGRLNAEERRLIEQHTLVAKRLLGPVGYLRESLAIPLYHHEWYDGTGYPEQLAGSAIPVEARIFAVIDVYDALRTERPYKQPMSHEAALEIIEAESGSHFEPRTVELFLTIPPSIWDALARSSSSVGGLEDAFIASRQQCDVLGLESDSSADGGVGVAIVAED
jgi:HD-GYP domain-containing protein (c-di-GMP phosphodiesterase class II)